MHTMCTICKTFSWRDLYDMALAHVFVEWDLYNMTLARQLITSSVGSRRSRSLLVRRVERWSRFRVSTADCGYGI